MKHFVFRLLWKEKYSTSYFDEKKINENCIRSEMQKLTNFLELGWIFLSFNFSKLNQRSYFTHHLGTQLRFWMKVACINSQTARGSLHCWADWPGGIMNWPLSAFPACSALGLSKTLKFGLMEDKEFLHWNQDPGWLFEHLFSCLASTWDKSTQTGYSPSFLCSSSHWFYL